MAERERRVSWRAVIRSLHRDAGYLAVGLTLVYALSGLAVNHVADWDPNFHNYRAVHKLPAPLPTEATAAARLVLEQLGIREPAREIDRTAPDQLVIVLGEHRVVRANPLTGRVVEEGQRPRFLIRLANWLHLNRGKKAWTLVADMYAAGLLFLAISGLFMLPGRKGLAGRGGLFVALGIAVPVLYVVLSGGPEAHRGPAVGRVGVIGPERPDAWKTGSDAVRTAGGGMPGATSGGGR